MELTKNFRIEPNNTSGWELIETYEKETKDKNGKKSLKSFENVLYFPTLQQVINKYVELSSAKCNTLEDILQNLKDIKEIIKTFPKLYVVGGKLKQLK